MIKLVIFDFDGVFTDGKIIFDSNGNAMKHYHAKDGMGIFRLHDAGFEIGVISGWPNNVSQHAVLKHLKITRVSLGSNGKLEILKKWCDELEITLNEVAYMGDDLNDVKVMKEVGFVACPNDSVDEVKEIAGLVCEKCGGKGAVRELCEYLIGIKNDNTIIGTKNNNYIIENIKQEFNYQIKNFKMHQIEEIAKILKSTEFNIYFSGVGKSGNIAKHCCELLKSISLKTNYLDILNSRHGDIGVLKKKDILVFFSNSGNTNEILDLIEILKKKEVIIIGISSNHKSKLIKMCDYNVILPFNNEIGGNISYIPTNSIMSQIIFSNILVSLLKDNTSLDEYKLNHCSGNIGKSLCKIGDVLKTNYAKILFQGDFININSVYLEMIDKKTGCCFFTNNQNELLGILTDGDIRRLLVKRKNLTEISKNDLNKKFYFEDDIQKYLFDCNNKYNYIPVINNKKLIGIISNVPS